MPEHAPVTRLMLLPTGAQHAHGGALVGKVRHYRLASIRRVDTRPAAERFAHLKQAHD